MKKLFIYVFLCSTLIYSQNEENQILKIILKEIQYNPNKQVLQCEKGNISFSRKDYEEGINLSSEILDEFEKVAMEMDNQHLGKWCSACVSRSKWKKQERIIIQNQTIKRTLIVISKPIFDDEHTFCMVSFTLVRKKGSASGMSFILKKIENKWQIISTFDLWVT